jgi:hypothetical protein
MPLFMFILILYITYIYSVTFIQYIFIRRHSPRDLSISSSLVRSVGKTSLGCQAGNRTRACLAASRRTTAFLPAVNFFGPTSAFRHQGQSGTTGPRVVRHCPAVLSTYRFAVYRVAAIFPKRFQCFTVALKNYLFY